jgi:hypothetical protein
MSFLKSGEPLIVSDTSPKTQHKTWNRCCGEGCYISWDLHTLETPPDSPGSPRYALRAWATIANLGVPNSVRTF